MNTGVSTVLNQIRVENVIKHKKVIHQTGLLFFSQIAALLIGILLKSIQTRGLGPEGYGLFAFFTSITAFTVLFFRFGLFSSVKVLLANNHDARKERELFGAGFVLAFLIGLLYSLLIFAISFFVDGLFEVEIGSILRVASPLCFILPFGFLINSLGVGSNRIGHTSTFTLLNKLFFLIPLGLAFYFYGLSVSHVIFLNLSAAILAVLVAGFMFNPSLSNQVATVGGVLRKNRQFGIHLYTGQVADQAALQFGGLLIAYFAGTTELGFYSLAVIMCMPIALLSKSLSQSLFKGFAERDKVPLRVFLVNGVWLIGSMVFLVLFSKLIISFLFGNEFLTTARFVFPLALAGVLNGIYQPANDFIAVKGRGKWMRSNSIRMMVVTVVAGLILIPAYGAMGAAWTSVLGMATFAASCFYYYAKSLKASSNRSEI
ncbi:MAG: oligosaccharide flippase family protein [Candidatus Zixiibacteriota bacterium]|nr:MAG: oligosaccharide flippase family protein [candidate division Zixibacteria bacterium]